MKKKQELLNELIKLKFRLFALVFQGLSSAFIDFNKLMALVGLLLGWAWGGPALVPPSAAPRHKTS